MKLRFALAAGLLISFSIEAAFITVEAGDYERKNVLVEFKMGTPAPFFAVETSQKDTLIDGTDSQGRPPLQSSLGLPRRGQVDEKGNGMFVLPQLAKGQKRTFQIQASSNDAATSVFASRTDRGVELTSGQKPVFTYHTEKTKLPPNRPDLTTIFHRAAYIHPVFTPDGAQVTDDYPRNHRHHHGIWMAWTGTEFEGHKPDFWNMGEGKGTVEFAALDRTWSGAVHAGFVARHRYVDLTASEPKVALSETWTVRLYDAGTMSAAPLYLFDIEIKDECATTNVVKLPEFRYGGLCVRGNWAWNGKGKSFVLTSEGETDASKGDKNQVHARWVHLGGMVDGKFAGIATLAHPTNFRVPEPIRLNPAEPYFNFAPQQAGDMEITPEKPFTARYRFVVADGKPDRAELDRLWNDFAHPPVVAVRE
ncbi:MAG TPA: PmoA family protein [Candidatus Acidoferrum sp.]|nr:PmoA family protein [Candidatus Acidoferrum sp.]